MDNFGDLFAEASRDIEAEGRERIMTSASQQATAAAWPFLALAKSEEEFSHREALVADRLTTIASEHGLSYEEVAAPLRNGFKVVLASRASADPKALTAEAQGGYAGPSPTGGLHHWMGRSASLQTQAGVQCANCGHSNPMHSKGALCDCGCDSYSPKTTRVAAVKTAGKSWSCDNCAGTGKSDFWRGSEYAGPHQQGEPHETCEDCGGSGTQSRDEDVATHTFDHTGEAYDASQTRNEIRDGDVLSVPSKGVHGFLYKAWPTAVTKVTGHMHGVTPGGFQNMFNEDPMYRHSYDKAVAEAQKHGHETVPMDGSHDPNRANPEPNYHESSRHTRTAAWDDAADGPLYGQKPEQPTQVNNHSTNIIGNTFGLPKGSPSAAPVNGTQYSVSQVPHPGMGDVVKGEVVSGAEKLAPEVMALAHMRTALVEGQNPLEWLPQDAPSPAYAERPGGHMTTQVFQGTNPVAIDQAMAQGGGTGNPEAPAKHDKEPSVMATPPVSANPMAKGASADPFA